MTETKGKTKDPMQLLSPFESTTVGILAGTIEVTILQPMLYCKNATQQSLPLTLDPRILYRGLLMSVTNMSVLTGVQFPLTSSVTQLITGGVTRRLQDSEMLMAGFAGGAMSGILCGPMELVMIQQQVFGGNIINTPMQIVSRFGGLGLFRGLVTSCGREGFFTAGYMGINPAIARYAREQHGLSPAVAKSVGAVGSGLIAATLSHPLDTIKTCMQGDMERKKYTTLTGTASQLYAEGGAGNFLRGWSWRTGRMICAMFIMNECKVRLSPLLFPHHFQ